MPVIDPTLDHKNSVKRDELLSQPFVFWLPQRDYGSLPPELPSAPLSPVLGLYPNERDRVLISTVHHESMWASVVGIQASRFAVSGWELEGGRPRLQAAWQQLLLSATVGIVDGWVTFAAAGMASICNVGKWFIEVERYTGNRASQVKALHHLDPSRCWITSDPQRPVYYIDRLGGAHELRAHQVLVIMDLPDLTELAINSPMSAAARAYRQIVELASLEQYIYEKVSGRRPLAVNFIQGLNNSTLVDTIALAESEADRKGVVAYMGSIMAGIMGDTPLNLVSIPLAEIPDGIDADQIRKNAHLVYANALGDDPAGIDPALIGNRQLGAGTQATVLDDRASRGGVTNILRNALTQKLNGLMRDAKIQFAFVEKDLRDQKAQAEVSKLRADTRKVQVETGEMTAAQATNVAVDAGDLPPEYLIQDETANVTISDDENPEMAVDATDTEPDALEAEVKGGAGSGNWGHAGRPGARGGSGAGGGYSRIGATGVDDLPRALGARAADREMGRFQARGGPMGKEPAPPPKAAGTVFDDSPTANLVRGQFNELPGAHTEGIERVTFTENSYIKAGVVEAYGTYTPSTKIINMSSNADNIGVIGGNVMAHEVGHHVHMARMSDAGAEEWKRISGNGENARVSAYARTCRGEHFSEAYRAYAMGGNRRASLKKLEPESYKFMVNLFGRGKYLLPAGQSASGDWRQRYGK